MVANPRVQELLERGMAAARAGRREEARKAFAYAASLEPDSLEAWLWLGALAEEPRRSMEYLGRALEIDPDSLRAQRGMEWARRRLLATRAEAGRTRPDWQEVVSRLRALGIATSAEEWVAQSGEDRQGPTLSGTEAV